MSACGAILQNGQRCQRPLAAGSSGCGYHQVRLGASRYAVLRDTPASLSIAAVVEADDLFDERDDVCATCGETYDPDGDGWDGECGACADATLRANEHRFNPAPFCGKCGGRCEMDEWA